MGKALREERGTLRGEESHDGELFHHPVALKKRSLVIADIETHRTSFRYIVVAHFLIIIYLLSFIMSMDLYLLIAKQDDLFICDSLMGL